ncbi:MAG: DUF2889 domain-containing protein [Cellvibrionales bacterium]|nr:DUF2889 domain-containing protein [Cellvibrionales bacterium]
MSDTLDFTNPMGYPIREDFGQGAYHRGIRLEKMTDDQGSFILGELEDCNHGFRVKVYIDSEKVIKIEGDAIRTPLNTCFGAIDVLQQLVGCPLGLTLRDLTKRVKATEHCTHWLDLTLLAINHAKRDEAAIHYLVVAPDEVDEAQWVTVYRNGELVIEWLLHAWSIQQPNELAGKTLFKGFSAWASEIAGDDEAWLEAAMVLQKGYFVSSARRFNLNEVEGEPATNHSVMKGACYSYSEPQLSKAYRAKNSIRDFTQSEEKILRFE